MPALPAHPVIRRILAFGAPSQEFSAQWKNPSDVFSVLLILGGDVVGRALAQLAGSGITPVAFSFGKFQRCATQKAFDVLLLARILMLTLCSKIQDG